MPAPLVMQAGPVVATKPSAAAAAASAARIIADASNASAAAAAAAYAAPWIATKGLLVVLIYLYNS